MDRAELYRQEAAYCTAMAAKVPTEKLRADWLSMANKWLTMATEMPNAVSETAREETRAEARRETTLPHR